MNIEQIVKILSWPFNNISMVSDFASIIGMLLTVFVIRSLRQDYSFSRDLSYHSRTLQTIQTEWNDLLAVKPVIQKAVTESLSKHTSTITVLKRCPAKEISNASGKLLSLMKRRSAKNADLSTLMDGAYDLVVEIRGHLETEIRIRKNRSL